MQKRRRQSPQKILSRRSLTLLEVMVGIALLLLATGVIGWNMQQAIAKKKFQSDLGRLRTQWISCQRVAMATQTDWKGQLRRKGGHWTFIAESIDGVSAKSLPPLDLNPLSLFLDGKKTDELVIQFFSSGQVQPEGVLLFAQEVKEPSKQEWRLPEIFNREVSHQTKRLGPIHPDEEN